jgi:hypothetical protein
MPRDYITELISSSTFSLFQPVTSPIPNNKTVTSNTNTTTDSLPTMETDSIFILYDVAFAPPCDENTCNPNP